MSETTDKINKLATQHEIIGAKTDCKYFSNIGNLCSRVENGMMRCDEYLECEFKYIDALKEENKQMQERLNNCEKFFNELGELLNEEVGNAYWTQAILHKIKKQKEYIKDLQVRKDRYYLQVLEYERQVSDWISFYIKVRDIISGNYEILDSQGLQDLRRIVNNIIADQKESENQ